MKLRDAAPLVATGIALALAFPGANLWPLAYVGLVPLLVWLRGKTYRSAFFGGVLSGLVFHGIVFSWFVSLTYWVGAIVLLGVTLLVLLFSLFWGAVAIGKCLFERYVRSALVVVVPAMWILMEYVENHVFTGFGWGSLGYTQWKNLYVAQLSSIGSIYSVGFFIVIINVLVYEVICHLRKISLAATAAGAVIALGVAVPVLGKMHMDEPDMSSSLRVGVIQPNFSLDVKWSIEFAEHMLREQAWMTERVAAEGAELVVWPESALFGCLRDQPERIARIVRANDVYLLMGSNHYEMTGLNPEEDIIYLNSAFLISPKGEILGRYDKKHLAPFGEYVPLAKYLSFLGKVVPMISDFTPGSRDTIFEIGDTRFAVVICFENSFPHLVREMAAHGCDFLIQITNDGWFGRTAQPEQDLAIAVFRAIENGATLVRAANTGISCFIDPWGRISGMVRASWGDTVFVRGTSTETISTTPHDTFYKTHGDVWVVGCGLVFVIAVGVALYRRIYRQTAEK